MKNTKTKLMNKNSFLFLALLLFAIYGRAQQDYNIRFFRNGNVAAEHRCSQVDSITFDEQNSTKQMLLWQKGRCSTFPMIDVDSVNVVKAAEIPQQEGRSIVFAEGVSQESGWYDVNKVGRGENGDINMCWAAAASNIIQWWQDRYVAAGGQLPSGAVSGPGTTYELALMELFHQQWDNEMGGHVPEAVPWYFEGVFYGENAAEGTQAYPLPSYSGGFFKDIWSDIYPHLYHDYTYMFDWYQDLYVGEFNNYYLWGNGTNLLGEERLRVFTDLVVQSIDRGIASMTISLSSNLSSLLHATTLWGYEIDHSTGLLTRLWITDSDDLETEPKQPILHEYTVSIGEGMSHIKLSSPDVRYGACYVAALCPVSGYKMSQETETETITDGAMESYDNLIDKQVNTLNYVRTLPNLHWNALYVPFEIPYDAIEGNYEAAYINAVHSYDKDDDGTIDELAMEAVKIKSGTLKANYPYLIKARSEAARTMNLSLKDVILHAAEETTVDCSSVYRTFEITGSYTRKTAEELSGKLAISLDGAWQPLAEGTYLNPFRLYLSISHRDDSPLKVSEAALSHVRIIEEGETTGIISLAPDTSRNKSIYDLSGRRIMVPQSGQIYIINGKKTIYQ